VLSRKFILHEAGIHREKIPEEEEHKFDNKNDNLLEKSILDVAGINQEVPEEKEEGSVNLLERLARISHNYDDKTRFGNKINNLSVIDTNKAPRSNESLAFSEPDGSVEVVHVSREEDSENETVHSIVPKLSSRADQKNLILSYAFSEYTNFTGQPSHSVFDDGVSYVASSENASIQSKFPLEITTFSDKPHLLQKSNRIKQFSTEESSGPNQAFDGSTLSLNYSDNTTLPSECSSEKTSFDGTPQPSYSLLRNQSFPLQIYHSHSSKRPQPSIDKILPSECSSKKKSFDEPNQSSYSPLRHRSFPLQKYPSHSSKGLQHSVSQMTSHASQPFRPPVSQTTDTKLSSECPSDKKSFDGPPQPSNSLLKLRSFPLHKCPSYSSKRSQPSVSKMTI